MHSNIKNILRPKSKSEIIFFKAKDILKFMKSDFYFQLSIFCFAEVILLFDGFSLKKQMIILFVFIGALILSFLLYFIFYKKYKFRDEFYY